MSRFSDRFPPNLYYFSCQTAPLTIDRQNCLEFASASERVQDQLLLSSSFQFVETSASTTARRQSKKTRVLPSLLLPPNYTPNFQRSYSDSLQINSTPMTSYRKLSSSAVYPPPSSRINNSRMPRRKSDQCVRRPEQSTPIDYYPNSPLMTVRTMPCTPCSGRSGSSTGVYITPASLSEGQTPCSFRYSLPGGHQTPSPLSPIGSGLSKSTSSRSLPASRRASAKYNNLTAPRGSYEYHLTLLAELKSGLQFYPG